MWTTGIFFLYNLYNVSVLRCYFSSFLKFFLVLSYFTKFSIHLILFNSVLASFAFVPLLLGHVFSDLYFTFKFMSLDLSLNIFIYLALVCNWFHWMLVHIECDMFWQDAFHLAKQRHGSIQQNGKEMKNRGMAKLSIC